MYLTPPSHPCWSPAVGAEVNAVNERASIMVCFSLALNYHSTEQVTGTSLIMIKTITKSSVDTGGMQPSIHPLYSSSKSLPLPANENEFIVTYLFHWLCLQRREDIKLSSFEIDAHWGRTIEQQQILINVTGCESHLEANESKWLIVGLQVKSTHHWSNPVRPIQAHTGMYQETHSDHGHTPPCTELGHTEAQLVIELTNKNRHH